MGTAIPFGGLTQNDLISLNLALHHFLAKQAVKQHTAGCAPQLLGIVPKNAGGFGSIGNAAEVFVKNEIEPLQMRFRELNDWIGEEVVAFTPYELPAAKP